MLERSERAVAASSGANAGHSDLEVAVIGMACRFPGANSVEAFWDNLRQGRESISFFTDEEMRDSGVIPELLEHPGYVRAAGVLDDVERFDARFFGFTAREAQALDPQHRQFLELAWEAMERAGYDPRRCAGRVGVFGGSSGSSHYWKLRASPHLRESVSGLQALLSTDRDFLSSRVAYKLDLTGPAVTVQTACSTSLAAVHLACQSLLAGECDMALAGGASIAVPQKVGYLHEPDGVLSRDGHCRTFDALASGTVKGGGVGIAVLKRLADAVRDGDLIEAVVKGWAMNNDGANRVGFTAPGLEGQIHVVRLAQAMAGVAPDSIGYVEAHGTGTALGDPIEVAALTQVFGAGGTKGKTCAVGSVKTNIGHLDAAAGIAAFIKAVLMLKHGELVPSLHYETPNPKIDFANSPFYVPTRTSEWPARGAPRRAGVSSLGMGGTNVHVILEEPPARAPGSPSGRPVVITVSAPTETALERISGNLAVHLECHPDLAPADVAFTLSEGRHAFPRRRAVVCRVLAEGARALSGRDEQRVVTDEAAEGGRPVAFLFTGQGAQYADMARGLYETEPTFRAEVDSCCESLRPLLALDLRELLYPRADELENAAVRLNETRFTQPALFTIEHALTRLWESWGVVPEAMLGHSVGEYVAACVSGVMTRDEALALVAERGRLMQACPPGAMVAVALSEESARTLLSGSLALAVVNGPEACVIGGPIDEVERLEGRLRERDITFSRVPTSHAFHSPLVEPALAPFAARVARVRLQAPRIPFVSNVTGTWITPGEATDPAYWALHLRRTVRFSEGLGELLRQPGRALLEVGPGPTLVSLAKRRTPSGCRLVAVASVRHPRESVGDDVFVRLAAARLWAAGAAVDWAKVHPEGRRRVLLPSYPFEGERYSLEAAPAPGADPARVRTVKAPVQGGWLYVPSWKRTEAAAPSVAPSATHWCLCTGAGGPGAPLAARLRAQGARVSVVRAGTAFARTGTDEWVVDPSASADYARVLDDLQAAGGIPQRFVHLWCGEEAPDLAGDHGLVDPGFLSLLRLAQALGPRQSRDTILSIVTSGALDVTGVEPLSPRRSTILALSRVIPQEYPLLSCRSVDVDAASSPAEILEQIHGEAVHGSGESVVACRGRYRWTPSFEAVASSAFVAPRLRPRGVYLITGGLGRVGLALAGQLARAAKARVALTGRAGLPDRGLWDELLSRGGPDDAVTRRVQAVRELEALGGEVLILSADAADAGQMRRALTATRERFGRLDGVIHAAADLGPVVLRPLARVDRADCEHQLRAKAGGAEVLGELLGDERLDFVLLTSSLSTALGGVGYASYAAANQYLDTFARRQHQRGRPWWMAVDWDGWRFATDAVEGRSPRAALSPSEGGEAFARVLGLGLVPQVLVSATPLPDRLRQWVLAAPAEEQVADEATPDTSLKARPDLHAVYVAPERPVEKRLAEIWGQLLGVERVGLDDNFFELGGSSLLAVHLMGRLRREFSGDLSVSRLFDAPTVRALARLVEARSGGEHQELERGRDRGRARREARLGPEESVR